jgi:hypothetical protein
MATVPSATQLGFKFPDCTEVSNSVKGVVSAATKKAFRKSFQTRVNFLETLTRRPPEVFWTVPDPVVEVVVLIIYFL